MHYVRSLYYKQQRDFAEFYKSSLLYLAFISMDSLPEEQKLVRHFLCQLSVQKRARHATSQR